MHSMPIYATSLTATVLLTTHFLLGLHYGRSYMLTRSYTSVLATSQAACFANVLDNTLTVSLLCSRSPQLHAVVLSTLFQARYGAH